MVGISQGSSVRVNGKLLRQDRRAAFPSADALAQKCGASTPTVYRAERGGPIRFEYLNGMAKALGKSVDRYLIDAGGSSIVFDILGRWSAYLIAADQRIKPYIVKETVRLSMSDGRLIGQGPADTPQGPRTKIFENCRIVENVFFGVVGIEGWEAPSGKGSFSLSISRNKRWMEGFASWYDPDSDRIEASRYIMVRHEGSDFREYLSRAEEIMRQEIRSYIFRKKYEADYDISAAAKHILDLDR